MVSCADRTSPGLARANATVPLSVRIYPLWSCTSKSSRTAHSGASLKPSDAHLNTAKDNCSVEGSDEGSETIEVQYWDDLFEAQAGEATEWLVSYPTIAPHILPHMESHHKILVIGCGNSDLSTGLYEDGFRNITSMDISPVVIQQMKQRFGNYSEMRWDVEDVMEMSYPDDRYVKYINKLPHRKE
eukprot:1192030-Prorocentrum_minimum.AAC.7